MSQILVEQYPSPMKLDVLGAEDWPVMEEPVGVIEREVTNTETSYIVEGAGVICPLPESAGAAAEFSAGDLVTIMPETRCRWTITEAVERHYANG